MYLSYRISPKKSIFRVRDEGDGFDWKRRQQLTGQDGLGELHGRGISHGPPLPGRTCRYNDKGNEVSFEISHLSPRSQEGAQGVHRPGRGGGRGWGDRVHPGREIKPPLLHRLGGVRDHRQPEAGLRSHAAGHLPGGDVLSARQSRSATVRVHGPGRCWSRSPRSPSSTPSRNGPTTESFWPACSLSAWSSFTKSPRPRSS